MTDNVLCALQKTGSNTHTVKAPAFTDIMAEEAQRAREEAEKSELAEGTIPNPNDEGDNLSESSYTSAKSHVGSR